MIFFKYWNESKSQLRIIYPAIIYFQSEAKYLCRHTKSEGCHLCNKSGPMSSSLRRAEWHHHPKESGKMASSLVELLFPSQPTKSESTKSNAECRKWKVRAQNWKDFLLKKFKSCHNWLFKEKHKRWYSGWVKTYSGKIVTSLEGLGKCSYVICEVNVTGSDNVIWWP